MKKVNTGDRTSKTEEHYLEPELHVFLLNAFR